MPGWLIPILNALGPIFLKWALKFLESKYPGLGPVIKEILKFIEGEPDKQEAVTMVKESLTSSVHLPDTVKI